MDILTPRKTRLHDPKIPFISSEFKEKRLEMGLDQESMAKLLNVGLAFVRKVEQGNLSVNFMKLSDALAKIGLELAPRKLSSSPTKRNRDIHSKSEILAKLEAMQFLFKRKYNIEKMSLFGSYAREEAAGPSDIDILYFSKEILSISDLGQMILILENLFRGKKVDLVDGHNLDDRMVDEIMREKIDVKEL